MVNAVKLLGGARVSGKINKTRTVLRLLAQGFTSLLDTTRLDQQSHTGDLEARAGLMAFLWLQSV